LLVERGVVDSRAKARAAVEAGLVTVNGKVVTKPADTFEETPRSSPRPPIPGSGAGR
jgi:23S rRNA (cytidine1920-2'-O)/16S rRNA (cytidine1409-2'-O)-methyltransferase